VRDAGSLVAIRLGGNSHSKPLVLDFLRESGAFQNVAGENEESYINWNNGEETRPVYSVQTTKNYFSALGVPVARGRGWSPDDSNQVAVLGYHFWRTRFNEDPSIVGRPIQLDGRPYTVLGILPESHRTLMGYGFSPDVYVPRSLDDAGLAVYARVKPGMSIKGAKAALRTVAERLDREFPNPDWKYANRLRVVAIAGFARLRQDGDATMIGFFFASLLVVVGLVLLIACVNVAGLLLARASARRQEIAIRLALGASRGRLLQQLLAESLLLSLAGAGLGFFLAQLVAKSVAAIRLPLPVPIRLHIEPDWRVAGYAAVLAIAATVVCGLLPAWQSLKDSLTTDLRRERKLRLRRGLVVAQVAVSFVVLATASLFVQNLLRSTAIGPGFDVRQTLRAEVHLPPRSYADTRLVNDYLDRAVRELQSIPGIEAAAAARILPFTDSTTQMTDFIFTDTGERLSTHFHWNAVSPDFFRAMDIPVLAGRPFSGADSTGAKVVIVNKTFVDRYLGGRTPIGATFRWVEAKATYQIVGVVPGTKNMTIGEDDWPQLYQPLLQIDNARTRVQFVLRSATLAGTQLSAVRQALRRIEPAAGVEVATLYSSIGLAFLPSQIGAVLMGSVGLLGLLLAAVGLNGVMAYSVVRRTREIGVRIAVGADSRKISRMILLESAQLLALGSLIGIGIALLVTRPLAVFFVPGMSPSDPLSFGSVLLVLASTGLLATLGPVRRALAIDPMTALRYD